MNADRWGRGSDRFERYVARARRLVRTDEEFGAALEAWTNFHERSHGDVFGNVPLEDPAAELFVRSLYYDHVVDRLVGAVERTTGVALANRDPGANTDVPSVGYRELHERVVDDDAVADSVADLGWADGDGTVADFGWADGDGSVADFGWADGDGSVADRRPGDVGLLRDLYESVVPREVRLALGEYYTPRGVAELAVDAVGLDEPAGASVLDPGCGSGVFVAVCAERMAAALGADHGPDEVLERVTRSVLGMDLNPVAVRSTKLAYLLALFPVLAAADAEAVELPVFLTDALGLTREDGLTLGGEPFDPAVSHLVGNPPWITWSRLPAARKDRWRERYVDALGLFPHEGAAARLGHGNDDLAVPYAWVCIHRYLQEDGRAGFVLKRDLTKGPAGTLFRGLRVGDRTLDPTHVHDFGSLRPFGEQVGADAAVYALAADAEPSLPVETTAWRAGEGEPDFASAAAMRETLATERTALGPVDPDDRTSAWVRADAERAALGECAHEIRHGVKDDAQAVFSIDRDQLDRLEPDLVYPYVKSRHVAKYGLFGHELRLVPLRKAHQGDAAELRERYPRTYDYLDAHREQLQARSSSWLDQGPFYTVFGVGDYTWADYKVAWCRLGFKPHFAVVSTVEDEDLGEKQVVPGDHYMFVSTDEECEAHFLCALLNSAVYQRSLRDTASEGKASLTKATVSRLALPAYRGAEVQRRLAELSMEAHEVVAEHADGSKHAYESDRIDELAAIQAEIDGLAEDLVTEGTVGSSDDGNSGSGG